MEHVFLFGFGVLLVIISWNFMLKRTFLDDTRDSLFDLRDHKLRSYFLNNSDLGLNHPLYISLRNLINGHLRNTEKATLFSLIATVRWAHKNPELMKVLAASFSSLESKEYGSEVLGFSHEIRAEAAKIMFLHMVRNSAFCFFLVWILAFVRIIFSVFKLITTFTMSKPSQWKAIATSACAVSLTIATSQAASLGLDAEVTQEVLEVRARQA